MMDNSLTPTDFQVIANGKTHCTISSEPPGKATGVNCSVVISSLSKRAIREADGRSAKAGRAGYQKNFSKPFNTENQPLADMILCVVPFFVRSIILK